MRLRSSREKAFLSEDAARVKSNTMVVAIANVDFFCVSFIFPLTFLTTDTKFSEKSIPFYYEKIGVSQIYNKNASKGLLQIDFPRDLVTSVEI